MTEDFISFDLAKKLKEKGYTLDTAHHYDDNGGIVVSLVEFDERCVYPCPEIHQVLKWLRDKNIILALNPSYFKGENCLGWDCDIWVNGNYEHRCVSDNSYESASLAGIEYCLDNLI